MEFFSVWPFNKPDLNFELLLYLSSQEMSVCAVFRCIYNSLNLFSPFLTSLPPGLTKQSHLPWVTTSCCDPLQTLILWLIFSSLAPSPSLQQVVPLLPLTLVHHKPSPFSYLFFGGKKRAGWVGWLFLCAIGYGGRWQ